MKKLSKLNLDIFKSSLKDTNPSNIINSKVNIKNDLIEINNKKFKFLFIKGFYVVAFGKASQKMFLGMKEKLKDYNVEDYLVVSHYKMKSKKINNKKFILSTHPLVTYKSYLASKKLISFLKIIPPKSNIIFLISGGASSMLSLSTSDIDFKMKKNFINSIINLGVGEREVNYFRKKLSGIKGGKILSYLNNCNILNLILSDERSNQIKAISSGITIPQKEIKISKKVILQIAKSKYYNSEIKKNISKNIKTLKKNSNSINSCIIADRNDLINNLIINYQKNNFNKIIYHSHIFETNYSIGIKILTKTIYNFYKSKFIGNNAIIFTGEMPVKVFNKGKGGRNQHLVASMIHNIENLKNFCFCAFSTDGCDYIKGINGAYVDSEIIKQIKLKKTDYKQYIRETNTFYLHSKLNSLIKGDYTGNNFSDVYIFSYSRK